LAVGSKFKFTIFSAKLTPTDTVCTIKYNINHLKKMGSLWGQIGTVLGKVGQKPGKSGTTLEKAVLSTFLTTNVKK
jgi:hypothetical protein